MNRPIVALVLLVLFYALSFGVRTLVHRRSTGSSGFRGISHRAGSAGWLGGVAFTVALALGVAAPIAGMMHLVDPLFHAPLSVGAAGIALALLGISATWWAQSDMGASWRIGVKEDERTALIERGLFRWIRNPIFTSMLLTALGLALLLPNLLSVLGLVLLFAGVELQVRYVEEPHLRRTFGRAYEDYCRRAGRFVPGIGRTTQIAP